MMMVVERKMGEDEGMSESGYVESLVDLAANKGPGSGQ
jgi:hypothetical protein